jgi:cyclomaltodextrinase / maltogenic alpha-amylase / neopullulanase
MENQALQRREFLRLSIVLAGGVLVTACQNRKVSPPTGTIAAPSLEAGIQLNGHPVDAWAFTKKVRGSMANPAACQAVWIDNRGKRVQALLQEYFFSADVPIVPGENSLIAVCQHTNEEEELSNEVNITGRLQQRPRAIIDISLSGGRLVLDGSGSQPDELDRQLIREYIWSARQGNPAELFVGEKSGPVLELEAPAADGEYYLSLRVVDETGREDASTTYFVVENGQARIPDFDHENPVWVEEAIVYGVIPRLFGTPGALAIQDKLDDLADLGVNSLWLAPINSTPDYGYSVTDYFELRDGFGTKEQFREMIRAAHERGIRVLMDFVPNHTSSEHPYFKDTVEKGQDSPYWDFYDRDENGKYTYYFDWTHLPNLNYDHPEVRRMMLEAFSYWVREFDVDGFRVDACWGVQQRRPDFWPEWRRELKRIKPDLLLLAEASARDPYNFENGFDAAYDWTENLGQWAWGSFWSDQADRVDTALMLKQLRGALLNEPEGYHPDALIFRFLNNNDTRTRFITSHGENLTRVATALVLTLPGLPCIYTADELGQWFLPYDGGMISWKERYPGLREYHKKLIALRRRSPSLHSRLWQLLDVEPAGQALGYLRFLEGNAEPVLVLLNFSNEPAAVQVNLPDEFNSLTGNLSLFDHLNGEEISFNAGQPILMNPMSARILSAKKD